MSLFQLKSDHEHEFECHPRREESQPLEEIQQSPPPQTKKIRRKVRIKTLPSNDPNQFFFADALVPMLEDSLQFLPSLVSDAITTRRKDLQMQVYYGLVEDQKDYLARMYRTDHRPRQWVRQMLNQTFDEITKQIMKEIMGHEYEVFKIQSQGQSGVYGKGTQAAIRIKQQLLKVKISDLRADLTIDSQNESAVNQSSLLNLNSADLYTQSNPRTKKAQDFVKKMQKKQQEQREHTKQRQYEAEQRKKQRQEQKREMQLRIQSERHQFLVHQYQQKKKRKEEERMHQEEEKKKFEEFYSQFKTKKPLYKKYQQQFFKNIVMDQNNKKMEILRGIRNDHRSISLDELREHEKQYLQIKEDHEYESNAARAMQEKARKQSQKKYYKSKYHTIIEKQEKEREEVEDELQKKQKFYSRRWEYATEIKTKFVPKTSPIKQKEIKEREEKFNWLQKMRKNKRVRSGEGCKNDGKDNLEKLHKYVGELRAKGKIKKEPDYRSLQFTPQPHSSRYKNYLNEIRESGTVSQFRPKYNSIDYSSLAEKDAEKTKFDAYQKEASAMRREQYLVNLRSGNLEKLMEQKKKVDDDFLESAKAKIALLNKFDGSSQ